MCTEEDAFCTGSPFSSDCSAAEMSRAAEFGKRRFLIKTVPLSVIGAICDWDGAVGEGSQRWN